MMSYRHFSKTYPRKQPPPGDARDPVLYETLRQRWGIAFDLDEY